MEALLTRARCVSPSIAAALSAFMLGVQDAAAQDLQAGFDEASNKFRRYVKQGAAIGALICTIVSLCIGGWKFMNKDPGAVWYLVGVVAGGIVFGIAQEMG
jgi:hypothetical protein